jgi:ribose 5-phosphate isomerase RpiB
MKIAVAADHSGFPLKKNRQSCVEKIKKLEEQS